MKKVLSFVLVLAMILGSVSMAFAADPALPFEDAPNSKLATVLRDLGVLKGSDNKVFLDTPVSRAEICAILMRVLGYEAYCTADYAIDAASSFADVEKGKWYNGYVNVAAQLGYVDGVGGGKFNPLGNVGLNDGVAFVMKALGYSAEHLLLDWPYNFLVPAQTMGLLEGVDTKAAELTRKDMFTIIYNALEEPLVKWVYTNPVKPELGGKFDPATKDPGTFDTFAELASGNKALAELKNIYATGYAFIEEDYSGMIANEDLDLDEYVGQNVIVLSKGGLILAVLGEGATNTSDIEYNAKYKATTIAGMAISGSAVVTPDGFYYRNGEQISAEDHDALEIASAKALTYGIDWTVNAHTAKNAKKVNFVDALYSASYEIVDDVVLVDKAMAASFAALATKCAVKSGYDFYLNATGDAILTEVRGAASSVDEIKEGDILEIYRWSDAKTVAIINVVRDDVEDVLLKKVVSGKYTFDNGETYEKGSYVIDADDALSDSKRFVSPMALKLDSNGDIVYATIVGITEAVPETSTGYAVVVYQKQETTYKFVETSHDPIPQKNNKLVLMPFGASEALSFENVSVAGLATVADGFVGDAKADTGEIAEYCVSADGKILAMTKAATYGTAVSEKKVANGKVDGSFIASDVVIVKSTTSGVTNAAAYGVYTMADIEGQTISGIKELNVLNAVKVLIVTQIHSAAPSTDKTYSSPVALLVWTGADANGTIVSYFDGETKEVHATKNAAGLNSAALDEIYTVEFDKATGKITSVEAFGTADLSLDAAVTTAEAITITAIAGNISAVQYDSDGAGNVLVANVNAPTVWVLTAKGFVAGTEETLAKNIAKYYTTSIDFYEVGAADGAYEFVVIK